MKRFFKLSLQLALFIASTTLLAQDSSKDMVEVIFTQDMDKEDLDSIKQHVKRSRVTLQINNAEFKDGLLHSIDFIVSTPKGKGSATGEIDPDQNFGFHYYPSGGDEYAFIVGSLDVPSKKKEEKE